MHCSGTILTSTPQEAVLYLTDEDVGTVDICYPSLHQVPIDVTAGWVASPVGTRPPGLYLHSNILTTWQCYTHTHTRTHLSRDPCRVVSKSKNIKPVNKDSTMVATN